MNLKDGYKLMYEKNGKFFATKEVFPKEEDPEVAITADGVTILGEGEGGGAGGIESVNQFFKETIQLEQLGREGYGGKTEEEALESIKDVVWVSNVWYGVGTTVYIGGKVTTGKYVAASRSTPDGLYNKFKLEEAE